MKELLQLTFDGPGVQKGLIPLSGLDFLKLFVGALEEVSDAELEVRDLHLMMLGPGSTRLALVSNSKRPHSAQACKDFISAATRGRLGPRGRELARRCARGNDISYLRLVEPTRSTKTLAREVRFDDDYLTQLKAFEATHVRSPGYTLVGHVRRVGGKEPKVTLDVVGRKLSLDVASTQLAQDLAQFLYREVSVTGTAWFDLEALRLDRMIVEAVAEHHGTNLLEVLRENGGTIPAPNMPTLEQLAEERWAR